MNVKALYGWLVAALILTTLIVDLSVGQGLLRHLLLLGTCLVVGVGFVAMILRQGLFSYVVKRVGEALFVLFLIVSLTFVMLRFLPGGPFDTEKALPAEVKANIEAKYHLNAPLLVQYAEYLKDLAQGDLGQSYKYVGRNVTDILMETLPASFQLGTYALIVSFLIGIPLGVIAAAKHNTWIDTFTMTAAMSGVALPSFLGAPILILIFSYWANWLPPALWEGPEYYLLPVVTLGIRPAAIIARLTRSSVLDVIHSDYIRTARAKGVHDSMVLFKHVLRNSLLPVITVAGPLVATTLSGAFIIELIFAVPGAGKHFVESVTNRDYPVILGATIVFATLLVLANLVVDLLYTIVDPRIRLS